MVSIWAMKERSAESKNVREYRRLRAVELFNKGMKAIKIAEILGVTRGAVSQWLKRYREQGLDSLYHRKIQKKPCKLTDTQIEDLKALLHQGAEKSGYCGDVWTASRIRDQIEIKFAIKYTVRHVQRLMKKWGWSPQKPATYASQKNMEEVSKWREQQWPEIKKKPGMRIEK